MDRTGCRRHPRWMRDYSSSESRTTLTSTCGSMRRGVEESSMSIRLAFAAAAIAFVVAAQPAHALDPKARITQYRHTAWRVQEGAFESAANAVVQTVDGYIWIASDTGLVRFDGV